MTFNPLPAVEEPTWSISKVIKASLAKAVSLITAALAAVAEVVSLASIDNLVLSIVEPASLISTIIVDSSA